MSKQRKPILDKACEMYISGMPIWQISKELNLSSASVHMSLKWRNCIKRPKDLEIKKSDSFYQNAYELYSTGLTLKEVSAKINRSVPTIRENFRHMGFKLRPNKLKDNSEKAGRKRNPEFEKLFSEFIAGTSAKELSIKYSMPRQSIYHAFKYRAKVGEIEQNYKDLTFQRKINNKKIQIYNGVVFNLSSHGYYKDIKGDSGLMHRYVWETERGPIPKDYHIHHINKDKGDNRIENLECLTPREHSQRHLGPTGPQKNRAKKKKVWMDKIIRRAKKQTESDFVIPEKFRWDNSTQLAK